MSEEHKHDKQAFAASAPWRKVLLEHALDAVVGMDQDQNIIDWNKQAEEIFGWSKEEVIGRQLAEIVIPQEYRKSHDDGLARFLKTGEGQIINRRIEVTALHRSKRVFPVELTVIPVLVEGKYLFYSFLRDISERKDNEERLRNLAQTAELEKSKFETIFAESPAIMALFRGPTFIFERTNAAYQQLIGHREVIGKSLIDALPELKETPFTDILKQVLETGEPRAIASKFD